MVRLGIGVAQPVVTMTHQKRDNPGREQDARHIKIDRGLRRTLW